MHQLLVKTDSFNLYPSRIELVLLLLSVVAVLTVLLGVILAGGFDTLV